MTPAIDKLGRLGFGPLQGLSFFLSEVVADTSTLGIVGVGAPWRFALGPTPVPDRDVDQHVPMLAPALPVGIADPVTMHRSVAAGDRA